MKTITFEDGETELLKDTLYNAIDNEFDYLNSLHGDDLKNEIEFTELLIGILSKFDTSKIEKLEEDLRTYKGE